MGMVMSPSDADRLSFMLGRLGYGPRPGEHDAALDKGADAWLAEQLAAPAGDTTEVAQRLAATKLPIKYKADDKGRWPAVDEQRPLAALDQPIEAVWTVLDPKTPRDGAEKGRPRDEVIAATLIRAVYSPWQLREVMTQFWHDHFHVNAFSGDQVAVGLPAYDRDVIRANALGNFRAMTEAVATSASMQYYLSNHSSRAGSANENYGRELFELHTLGAAAYLNDTYDRWRNVPGALAGRPQGYIDQDVYESARAFTGWTIEDGGHVDGGRVLPNTGKFVYIEKWHDGYQKRVLATEFQPFQSPMTDGRQVLDLVTSHPATALHLARKLCQRLVGPGAGAALIQQVAQRWQATQKAPDQIAQIVRLIAQSPDFWQSRGAKVKRPLGLLASFARTTDMDFTPTAGLFGQMTNAGQKLFGAPTPAGLADTNETFTGVSAMRQRWNMLLGLAKGYWNTGPVPAVATLRAWGYQPANVQEAVQHWLTLFGSTPDAAMVTTAMDGAGLTVFDTGDDKALATAAAIAAMSPAFQVC